MLHRLGRFYLPWIREKWAECSWWGLQMFQMCMNALQTEAGIRRRLHPRSLSSLPEFCIRAKYRALHEQHSHTTGAFSPRWKSAHSWQSTTCLIRQDRWSNAAVSTSNVFFFNAAFYFRKLDFAIRTKKEWTEPKRFLFRWVYLHLLHQFHRWGRGERKMRRMRKSATFLTPLLF